MSVRWPVWTGAAAFVASLIPFHAFWVATPDYPGGTLVKLWAAGVALWLLALSVQAIPVASRWIRAAPVVAAVLWLALALRVAGPAATLGFFLTSAAALALGARLLKRLDGLTPLELAACAYLAGMSVLVALASLTLALPVHHSWTYALVAVLLVAWQRRSLLELGSAVRAQLATLWKSGFGGNPALALLVFALWAWGALGTLTPVASADDLSYHLRLPYELLVRGAYSFDFVNQVWAVAPWASDLAFAIPFVASQGSEGVKVWVSGSYHFCSAVLLLGLLVRRVPPAVALLFLAGYLAIPLVMAVNHSLHTEGISAAAVLAVFALWTTQRHTASTGLLLAVALLLGLLGAAKATNLVACAFLGLLWLPPWWRHVRRRPLAGLIPLAGLSAAFIPYATAWLLTGNPVFPLFNGVFRSPYFYPANFRNDLFTGMFDLHLFPRLFLSGTRLLETWTDVAGGLALFFLLPSAAMLLVWKADAERRAALAVAIGAALILLASQQYLRYLFPVMALAVFAVSRVWDFSVQGAEIRAAAWRAWWSALLLLAIAVGAASMPLAFWQTRVHSLALALKTDGREAYLRSVAPDRGLTRVANEHMGVHATVLYMANLAGADLHGTPIYPAWFNPGAREALEAVSDEASAGEFLHRMGVTHVIGKHPAVKPSDAERLVEAYARRNGRVLATSADLVLLALNDDEIWRRPVVELRDEFRGRMLRGSSVVVGQSAAAPGPLLVQADGVCESVESRPWVELRWLRKGQAVRIDSKTENCLPQPGRVEAVFQLYARLEGAADADEIQARFGFTGAPGASLTTLRVRALQQPATGKAKSLH